MILSFIKNSCGVCGLGVTSSPTGKLSPRNYDGKHSVRDSITENFLSICVAKLVNTRLKDYLKFKRNGAKYCCVDLG